MLITVRRGALVAITALVFAIPATARAESVTLVTASDSTTRAATVQGPTVAASAVAVQARHASQTSEAAAAAQSRAGLGKPRALMFVGLGTFIAGALIGNEAGTIIMIGGAAMGLYGLYQYLQ